MRRRKLLDANHLSDAIRPASVRARIREERRRGIIIDVCIPTLCEVQFGLALMHKRDTARRDLRCVSRQLRVWPLDTDFPVHYAEIAADLRRRGRVLSQVDIMLAALCRQMDLTLLTSDRGLEALPDLRVENWLA